MKKYLITCAVIIAVIVGWISVSRHLGLVISLDNKKQVETFTTVEGKTILLDQGRGMEPFEIRGVNMGVGIPGHFATDYAIDKDT